MASREHHKHYREIITKAVCGKGRKFTQATHAITPAHKPTSILGCWLINHEYKAKKDGDCVIVHGSYEANIWYSYSDNTKTEVATEKVTYHDEIPLHVRDKNCLSDDFEVIVRVLQQPNCLEATISPNGNKVIVQVERELAAEIIGETKVCVKVDPDGCAEEFEEFESDDFEEEFEDLDPQFLIGEEE